MKAFKLNFYANWKSLPWNQINERIFIIQNKIYQASKACQYDYIHKMQNTLINSNEVKVLAIQEILKSFSKSSLNYNQVYYQLSDKDKFLLFYNLFQKEKTDKVLMILREKIKQYILYLCIQPEWEARFEPGLQSNLNGHGSYISQEKLVNFLDYRLNLPKDWHRVYLEYQVNNKYINTEYINKKIRSGNYINYCLSFWLDNNYIEEFTQDLILSVKFNALHQFLYRIICNGIEWFYSMAIEIKFTSEQYNYNIYKNLVFCYRINTNYCLLISANFISNLTFILELLGLSINKYKITYGQYKNHNFYTTCTYNFNIALDITQNLYILIVSGLNNNFKLLFRSIKSLLYIKDFRNRLRANNSINISKTILSINRLIVEFYDYYYLFLSLRIIKYIYHQIDFILYSWLKKRNNKGKDLIKITIHRNKKYIIQNLAKYKHNIIKKICLEKLNR